MVNPGKPTERVHQRFGVWEEGSMKGALQATGFLEHVFKQHLELRDAAMAVAQKLRETKQMSTEGTIGDTLKSMP